METEVILDCVLYLGMCYFMTKALYEKHKNRDTQEAIYYIVFACFLAITLSA